MYLWAKGRAGQSSVGCKGVVIAHWVSQYALSPTHLLLMATIRPCHHHLGMAEQSGDTKAGAAGSEVQVAMLQGAQLPNDTRTPLGTLALTHPTWRATQPAR